MILQAGTVIPMAATDSELEEEEEPVSFCFPFLTGASPEIDERKS